MDLFSVSLQPYLSTFMCRVVNAYLNMCGCMLAYFSNNNAVYRVHKTIDTSHSYVSFLSTKTYYNSVLFLDICHAYISPRPADTAHICLSLCQQPHIARMCHPLQTHLTLVFQHVQQSNLIFTFHSV